MAHSTQRGLARRRQREQARRLRNAAEIAGWIDQYKLERGCVDCGFARWPESLHFDHVDPATKLRSLGWFDDRTKLTSRTRMEAFKGHVIQYCEVRCANCHAHRSRVERHWRAQASDVPPAGDLTLF